MPSEAEWEYAARGGGRNIVYPWGNEEVTCERTVFIDNGCEADGTMEVCSKPLGNTAQGLCDMAGNVWECVEDDWHESYRGAPSDGRAWIDITRSVLRVLRGGSWSCNPGNCRSAYRVRYDPDDRDFTIGFRIVLDSK